MTKEEILKLPFGVPERRPDATSRVRLANHHEVIAHLAGRGRANRIRVLAGGNSLVEMTRYDLARGRITYRFT